MAVPRTRKPGKPKATAADAPLDAPLDDPLDDRLLPEAVPFDDTATPPPDPLPVPPSPEPHAIEDAILAPMADDPARLRPEDVIPPAPPAEEIAPVSAPAPRSGGMLALLAGGLIAGGIGFGAAQFVPEGWPMADTAALEAQLAEQATALENLRSTVAELPPPPDLSAQDDGLAEAIAAVQSSLDAQGAQLATLEIRLTDLENRPAGTGGGAPVDLSAIEDRIAALQAQVDSQSGAGATLLTDITAAAESAEARLAETEAQAAALQAAAEETARAAATGAALARIQAAIDSGAPYAASLADLGTDIPEALAAPAETGVPSLTALQTTFPEAARAALEVSLRADMGESLTERMGSFLRSATGARSLTPREGTDPDAVLSRAEAALRDGNLPQTLTELGGLPPEGQAAMAAWVAEAQTRIAATEAVTALATAMNSN